MGAIERIGLDDGFLLHRRKFRETSLLLDVFSREQGVVRLIAKGAMRGKDGRSGVLQPFLPLSLAWVGRGDLPVLTVADARAKRFELTGRHLFCGFYLNELLLRLLGAHDPQPRLFEFYGQTLERLENDGRMEETLRFFELALLEELGYGLLLDHDAESGDAIKPEAYYAYRIELGPVECRPGDKAIRGSALLGLHRGYLSGPEESAAAKHLMRRVIQHYLGGKPLLSRRLFKYSEFSKKIHPAP